jgi:hypothetical protein
MSFQVGATVTAEECERAFNSHGKVRFHRLPSGKYLLPDFIEFQYGELNPENRAHRGVFAALRKEGLEGPVEAPPMPLASPLEAPSKDLPSPMHGAKDKDKDKEQDKDKDQDKEQLDFEAAWQAYPRKLNKTESRARFQRLIRTSHDFDSLLAAIRNYAAECRAQGTEEKFIKHFSSFLGTEDKPVWRDWVDHKVSPPRTPSRLKSIAGAHQRPDDLDAEIQTLLGV